MKDNNQSPLASLRPQSVLIRLILLALFWTVLTGGDPFSWLIGVPVVVFGSVAGAVLPPLPRWRWSLGGLLRFLIYFLGQSLWTGLDIARRAFDPRRPWAPRILAYRYRVVEGASRTFFANAVSLMPGTLSADLGTDELVVHALDHRQPIDRGLQQLEERVAAMFGLDWPAPASPDPGDAA